MPARTKKNWTPDDRGRYVRELGYKPNDSGKLVPHRFYLGTDLTEARRRNVRLEELWEAEESFTTTFGEKARWTDQGLEIGRQIAGGNYRIVIKRNGEAPETYATRLNMLRPIYPMVHLEPEPEEAEAYKQGGDDNRQAALRTIKDAPQEMKSLFEGLYVLSGALPESDCFGGESTLHDALNGYIDHIRQQETIPGTDRLSDTAYNRIRIVQRLIAGYDNKPLSSLASFDAIQALINVWRNRPMIEGTDPPRPLAKKTAQHRIREFMRFLRWLNRTSRFEWEKPKNFDELQTKVKEAIVDRTARLGRSQVQTYTLDELRLLNEYATPIERLLLLLGLNCGFGPAEQGRLTLGCIFLNQQHPHADWLKSLHGFESQPSDSYITLFRGKTTVYGEWWLWNQTVEAVKWARQRRERLGNAKPDALLLVTERGRPFFKQTTGGNRSQNFNRRWEDLNKRIRADHPEFRRLSFGKLRKTAGNLIRHFADGETAGIFLCHGQPVKSDDLLDVYTNRPFPKVFAALREVQEFLRPVFEAAPSDLTKQPMQRYTPLSVGKRVIELHQAGHTVREIAEQVGLSKSSVHRHLAHLRSEAAHGPG
jgi:hypothetical protein